MLDNRRQGKIITYKLADTEGDEALYSLTFRQARALLSTLDYFRWESRHSRIPDDLAEGDNLEEWVSGLELRLMKEVTPVSCDDVADCIETNDGVKDKIKDTVRDDLSNDPDFIKNIAEQVKELLAEQLVENLSGTSNTGCDKDILWAQCIAIARHTHTTVLDLLEVMEVQSNNVEMLQAIRAIPFAKALFAVIPVDETISFVAWLQDTVKEQYDGNWDDSDTPDGTAWKIAEKLFCACEGDCEVTLERIFNAYRDLLSGLVSLNWDNIEDFIETLAGVNDNSLLIVYAFHIALWGIAKFTSYFGNSSYDAKILNIILKMAVDDASSDWAGFVNCSTIEIDLNTKTCGYNGQNDGYRFFTGVTYNVTATGTCIYNIGTGSNSVGPAGQDPDPFTSGILDTAKCLTLILRLNDGGTNDSGWIEIGASGSFTPTFDAYGYWTLNELDVGPDSFVDNSEGPWHITIERDV